MDELLAALQAALPYARDAALRHERLGLAEEAAAAWAVYHQARRVLRAIRPGADGMRGLDHED
jgi:hypothetical protein